MTFTTGLFFIGLLPWFVLIYSVLGRKQYLARGILIALANVVFYFWGGAGSFLFICTFSVFIWLFSLLVFKIRRRLLFVAAIVFSAAPLLYFKYTLFFIKILNSLFGVDSKAPSVVVPVGISFITFEAISLLVDIFREKLDRCPSLLNTYLYLTFFSTVTSGPIIRYDEFERGLYEPSLRIDYAAFVERIALGLCKKILIADKIGVLTDYYFDGMAAGHSYSCIGLWIGSIAYTLQLYFDFSGYSDMAIGIGGLLGFGIRENFARPYQAHSISDFWRRWHMSLTQWFRDYVYIPLGGNRCPRMRHLFNMLVVWLLTGLWHGADLTFILWGLGYFILLAAEKYIPAMKRINAGIAGHIYTLFFVNLLWVPFRADNLSAAAGYLSGMFTGGSGIIIEEKAIRFIPLLGAAIILCCPFQRLVSVFSDKKWLNVLKGITIIILTGFAICGAINSSYAPYIYGNF